MTPIQRGPNGGSPSRPGERVAFGWGLQTPAVPARPAPRRNDGADAPAPPDKGKPPARERRDWGYLGLLAFTVILFLRPADMFPPLEALHLAEVTAIVGLVAMINGRLARQEPVLPLHPEVVGVLAFAGLMLALIPFSIWPGGSLTLLTGLYLKVVLIFILMAGTLTTAARLERFVWVIVLASAYLGFRGVFDYARGINMVENGRVAGAVGGVFGNPNDLALNMVAFLPPALLLAARRYRSRGRLVAAVASLLIFVTIVFTKSRGGFLGLTAMLVVLLVQGGKVRRGFGFAVIVAILVAAPLLPASFYDRMAGIFDNSADATGSREARKTDMREAWRAFLERPLTGVGPGEFTDYNPPWRQERWREAHNVWLQVAADDGIFGVLIFVSLVGMAARDAWSTSARRSGDAITRLHATAMTASIAGWIVCATFASVAYTWTFYYVFGIAAAARHIAERTAARERRLARAAAA